jgi:hypothetical protein
MSVPETDLSNNDSALKQDDLETHFFCPAINDSVKFIRQTNVRLKLCTVLGYYPSQNDIKIEKIAVVCLERDMSSGD